MPSYREIEKRAKQVLKAGGFNSVPIDIYGVAESLGIQVCFEEMENEVSGLLLVENGEATIAVNQAHHPNRQRFTTAHECAHFLLHSAGRDHLFIDEAYFRNSASSAGLDRREIEANAFAAMLLMPKWLLQQELQGYEKITDLDIYRLAMRFGVSEQAMTLRLVKLEYVEPQ